LGSVSPFAGDLLGKQACKRYQRSGCSRTVRFSRLCASVLHDRPEMDIRVGGTEMAQSNLFLPTPAGLVVTNPTAPRVGRIFDA